MGAEISPAVVQTSVDARDQKERLFFALPVRLAVVYIIFFAIAFFAYSVLWKNAPVTAPDSASYFTAAKDLSDFRINQVQERAPGYPLLLVLTGSTNSPSRTLFFVSLLLHFASIWLLTTVLYSAGLKQAILNMFGLVLLLPPYVEPAGYVLSENLTTAMLVTGLVSFFFWTVNRRTILIMGCALAIAYAGLTRPTYQILAFAIVGYLLLMTIIFSWMRRKWKQTVKASLVLIFGSAIVIGGYAFVNYRSVGYFGLSPKLGLTLSQKTLRVIERLPDEYAVLRQTLIAARNAELISGPSHTGYSYIWNVVPVLRNQTGLQYRELSDYMLRINWLLIRKAPLEYLQDVAWSFGSYWFPASDQLANMNSRSVQAIWAVLHFFLIAAFGVNLVLLVGAVAYIKCSKQVVRRANERLIGSLKLIHYQGLIYGLAATIVFYSAILSSVTEVGASRYRVPTDTLIVFMLVLGTVLWKRLLDYQTTTIS